MQPVRRLARGLAGLAAPERCIFTPSDMRALLSDISDQSWRSLLSRSAHKIGLIRLCRGLYLYQPAYRADGLLLFRAAARLRAGDFNYLSLETVLSEAGVISQIPQSWISVMTSGRSGVISCGTYGTIEFIHTSRKPRQVKKHLTYDSRYKMLRADVTLAIRDMVLTRRDIDLIDWSIVDEFT